MYGVVCVRYDMCVSVEYLRGVVYVCVHMLVRMCVSVYLCRGQKRMFSVLFYHSLFYSHVTVSLRGKAGSQQASAIPLSPSASPPSTDLTDAHTDAGVWHGC